MYNLYIMEKKQKELKEKEKQQIENNKYKQKFKSKNIFLINNILIYIEQIPYLYQNYENRVKNFISDVSIFLKF